MNQLTKAPADNAARPLPTPVPPALEVSSTYLAPTDLFPAALAELELAELQVLHSRITRQLDREYTDPAGPHPLSLDRLQELVDELDTRQGFLPLAGSASSTDHQAGTPRMAQGVDAARTKATSSRQGPIAGQHSAANATGQSSPTAPHQHEKPPSSLSPVNEKDRKEAGPRIFDLDQLRPGDQVQVWHHGRIQCVGTVEEVAPALGVVWIREGLDAYRRMIHTQDTELRSPGSTAVDVRT